MNSPTAIGKAVTEPDDETVKALRKALQLAEQGEIVNVAITAIRRGGSISMGVAHTHDPFRMMGALQATIIFINESTVDDNDIPSIGDDLDE